ncbi:MAG TPA: ATP-binding protein [Terracidiphilus sp.]|nr:ATP-binding protein [Terracidiphilus sp.]
MTIEAGTKAHAYPTKEFFVKMLTRDLALSDCILDLIDNSVDGAWRSMGGGPTELKQDDGLSRFSIAISVGPNGFSIEDNCGGMNLDDAVNYAFSFGKPEEYKRDPYSIGAYGIGMKRAIFKLGAHIRIRSTYRASGGEREAFAVPIDVNEWLSTSEPPWDFDIVPDSELAEDGVRIQIDALTPEAEGQFGSEAFRQNLRRILARDYSLYLDRGLRIVLNDSPIVGWQIALREGADFAPMRFAYDDSANENAVNVEIIGGMAASPPAPDAAEPEDQAERARGAELFGWYVVCNGRIVLAADRTEATGWGTDDWPMWHPQYAGFIGVILFSAENAVALPLTTTKRSIDSSSEVFRRAKPRMRELTRKWIDYTNQRKQALEDAKQKEQEAHWIPIHSVSLRQSVQLPELIARESEPVANVQYSVPLQRMRSLARKFGSVNLPYREVGLRSFNYAYREKVGEE